MEAQVASRVRHIRSLDPGWGRSAQRLARMDEKVQRLLKIIVVQQRTKNYDFAELIEQNCEKESAEKTPKEYCNG
ncbi:unnamed protein product [marine sediment metagenome]|uniref:Uncharacterized protein n=1 Tax=marine sediment metagenome TaxID=412755 RepID=X1PFF6_9ZZZZ